MGRKETSAGLLMCRMGEGGPEVLLVHPGGPFFAKRDDGAWTIPKGLVDTDEDLLAAARREFEEETGFRVEATRFVPLGEVRQRSGKVVHAWAFAGDADPAAVESNTFEHEWPPRSGRFRTFPEIDRAAFFDGETAGRKILAAQRPFVERALSSEGLRDLLGSAFRRTSRE